MPASVQTAFGETLRELRRRAGLSQERLWLESGVSSSFISLLERAKSKPSLTTVWALAEVLDVSPSALVRLVEDRLRSTGDDGSPPA